MAVANTASMREDQEETGTCSSAVGTGGKVVTGDSKLGSASRRNSTSASKVYLHISSQQPQENTPKQFCGMTLHPHRFSCKTVLYTFA